MDANVVQNESVGAAIWEQIRTFRPLLDIVENPSVGTLSAPEHTCQALGNVLKLMLQTCVDDEGRKVRVRCTVSTGRLLCLEVVYVTDTDKEKVSWLLVLPLRGSFPG